mmetsp:Transcript_9524/g.13309  ORF Transcript_9524/g.13309 Transcript_9524/m.13309 type:complete len:102 (+) Transcript_9524:91-396(+)
MIVPRTGTYATGNVAPQTNKAPKARYGNLEDGLTDEEKEIIEVAFAAFKNEHNKITIEGLQEACKTFPLGDPQTSEAHQLPVRLEGCDPHARECAAFQPRG